MEQELDKTLLELKRAHDLERRNAILVNMLQIMPNKGATERSIKEQEMQQLSAEELEHIRRSTKKPDFWHGIDNCLFVPIIVVSYNFLC